MGLKIRYTPRAKETYKAIYQKVKGQYGKRIADQFESRVDKVASLVAEYPLMFKAFPIDESIRIGLVSKQTSVFYRVTKTEIHILFFWDNRQEPFFI